MAKFFLTISIPTYNRSKSVSKLVNEILSYNGSSVNIVVQDNCSSDNTKSFFDNLKTDRVIYRRNDKNRGAAYNYLASLVDNDSDYSLFMIDKDYIDIDYLRTFIDFLKQQQPAYGYVSLNRPKSSEINYNIYQKGEPAIRATAYLSKHPTGYFYQSKLVTKQMVDNYFSKISPTFPFPFEIINAQFGITNSAIIIDMPLLRQETRDDAVNNKSYSYNENNLFFSPIKRIEAFQIYYNNLFDLGINNKDKAVLFRDLYKRVLWQVSRGYKMAFEDNVITAHYGLKKRKVSLGEMIINLKAVYQNCKNNKPVNSGSQDLIIPFIIIIIRLCLSEMKSKL